MAVEQFLDFGGVPGEATAPAARDHIPVLGWNLGVNRPVEPVGAPPTFSDLTVHKTVDSSSPLLLLLCSRGSMTPQAVLTVRQAGHFRPRLLLDMRDVTVTSVNLEVEAPTQPLSEVVHLTFARMWLGAARVDRDGTSEDLTWFSWDLTTGQPAS
jgi:type VI secretion system secreted protein Hcp